MKSVCCPVVSAGLAGAFADECKDDVCLVQTNMETTQSESMSIESKVTMRQRNKAKVKALIESLEEEKELVAEVLSEKATQEEVGKFTSFLQTVASSLFKSKSGATKAGLLSNLIQLSGDENPEDVGANLSDGAEGHVDGAAGGIMDVAVMSQVELEAMATKPCPSTGRDQAQCCTGKCEAQQENFSRACPTGYFNFGSCMTGCMQS